MPKRYAKPKPMKRRKTKLDRQIRWVQIANQHKPGFIGVATNFTFSTKDGRVHRSPGPGALFIGNRPEVAK